MLKEIFGHIPQSSLSKNLFFSQGGYRRRKNLMDSHPYSYETSSFTLGAPHEEVQDRQTKLHPGFTLGKLAVDIVYFHFFAFSYKN